MTVVSVESDGAIVVFREDASLQSFRDQIAHYQAGPRLRPDGAPAATSQYDILEFVDPDGMRSLTREDRIGARLAALIGPHGEQLHPNELYIVEMELWHPGTVQGAGQLIRELRDAYQANAAEGIERWLDDYVGSSLLLAKVRASGARLDQLLEEDIIASIDLPLAATFDVRQAHQAIERNFPPPPAPPADGPRLCVIDSGIVSNHPLLRPYVGHEEAILTRDATVSDTNGHGTRVAALAVYGDVRACYERGQFESTITLYSARVLNDQNGFDDEELIINQLRNAVETFTRAPYNCRVFNISIGGYKPSLSDGRRRQNLYGEILDIIAREYHVLLVVSAGNHDEVRADNIEEELATYPAGLLRPAARLCDFATTSIGLTVGALGESDALAIRPGMNANDIVRAVALRDEPAPMTRVGPGVQGAIKPELVHYGGSDIFDRYQPNHLVLDRGMAVMSFSHEPLEQLFDYGNGTSYAAPRVARLAALVEHQLRQQLDAPPHPNLIRAVLGASARIPEPARVALERTDDPHAVIKVCGYGLPDEERTLQSANGRVVLFAQAAIPLDYLHIYRVPVPDCLLQASGLRSITVALAFDPPVRARRLDYLGVEMDFRLIRGKTLDEVHHAYRRLQPGEDAERAFSSPHAISFEPKSTTRGEGGYSRKKSTLQCGTFSMKRAPQTNYGNDYWLVVRAERGWVTEEQAEQSYAVVVALEADTPELYAQVRQRIRQRVRVRV